MTLKEIIDKTNFMELWPYLVSVYCDHDKDNDMAAYLAMFEKLKTMTPVHRNDYMKIYLKYFCEDDAEGWPVDGIEEGVVYALDGTPWNEWLGMEIEIDSTDSLQPHEIAAHCLWEMSFYSFDEERTKAIFDDLKKTVCELETQGQCENDTKGD